MVKFNIWKSNVGVSLIRDDEKRNIDLFFLEEEFESRKIIHSFYAETWFEAMQKHYEFCKFGTYKPVIDPKTGKPFPYIFEKLS